MTLVTCGEKKQFPCHFCSIPLYGCIQKPLHESIKTFSQYLRGFVKVTHFHCDAFYTILHNSSSNGNAATLSVGLRGAPPGHRYHRPLQRLDFMWGLSRCCSDTLQSEHLPAESRQRWHDKTSLPSHGGKQTNMQTRQLLLIKPNQCCMNKYAVHNKLHPWDLSHVSILFQVNSNL